MADGGSDKGRGKRGATGDELAPTAVAQTPTSASLPGPDAPVRPSMSTIGHYVIESVMGTGGMGVVYAARDPKLERKVAIKVLRAQTTGAGSDTAAEHQRIRLLREARAMAKLSHPNVVTVYGADTHEGEVYFAMELVEGRTLRDWLATPRTWREVLRMLIGAGRGLQAAHAVGLIHRDFKPDNVLIDATGRPRVSDFGIASEATTSAAEGVAKTLVGSSGQKIDLTTTGQLIGTPRYMSPEQCKAGAVDARSDQFSFCLVLYEALYRRHAFDFGSFEELVARISAGDRAPVPDEPKVPAWVIAAIDRGLAVKPDERFESLGQLIDDLERHLEPSQRDSNPTLAVPDKPSIAVLPFRSQAGDAEQEYLADGIVESITAVLSRIRTFFVISRNTAFLYKGRARNTQEIGRELGIAYLLEGSLQKIGSRVRITVQLIDVTSGTALWADKYDGTLDDIFDLQDQITERVAGALQPSIRLAEIERARRKRPADLGAYDYTMRAMQHVWQLEKEEAAKGIDLLDRALAIDPDYPLALALKAWCLGQHAVYNWVDDTARMVSEGLALADRAASGSSDDPLVLTVLGVVHTFARAHGVARVMLERAIALDPNSAWALSRLGWLDVYEEKIDDAEAHFNKALRLSPLDPMNFNNYVGLACVKQVRGEYDAAAELFGRALKERPNARWIYRNLASALCAGGRMEEAHAAKDALLAAYPGFTVKKYLAAMAFSTRVLQDMADHLRKLGIPD